MSDKHPKELLAAILQQGDLKPREREAFESMYDKSSSGRRLTYKQKGWIEKVYYGQKLDRQGESSQRVAKLRYPGLKKEALVTTIEQFQKVCPGIERTSDQFKKVARFFRSGGEVLHLVPAEG